MLEPAPPSLEAAPLSPAAGVLGSPALPDLPPAEVPLLADELLFVGHAV